MSKNNQNVTSNAKMLKTMVGIGVLCGLLIVTTYETTYPRVQQLKAQALEQAIFTVLPGIVSVKTFVFENETFVESESGEGEVVYAGYDDKGNLKGIALEAKGQGYADIIKVLYGYDVDKQQVVGFYVLESKETPGLGDAIEKNEKFLENFKTLDVSLNEDYTTLNNKIVYAKSGAKKNPWEVDGITGATVSARAVTRMLSKSTEVWVPRIYMNKEAFGKFEK